MSWVVMIRISEVVARFTNFFFKIPCQGFRKKLYNDVPLARDLASDCDVTISVTFRISSNTNATDSILVSILL